MGGASSPDTPSALYRKLSVCEPPAPPPTRSVWIDKSRPKRIKLPYELPGRRDLLIPTFPIPTRRSNFQVAIRRSLLPIYPLFKLRFPDDLQQQPPARIARSEAAQIQAPLLFLVQAQIKPL